MLTEVQIDEPIEKIIGDWNFRDEKIVARGYVNPAGNCWNTAKGSDEERAARALW
jgi:hypothetical protein